MKIILVAGRNLTVAQSVWRKLKLKTHTDSYVIRFPKMIFIEEGQKISWLRKLWWKICRVEQIDWRDVEKSWKELWDSSLTK